MKYFFLVGEKSGDLHASQLYRELLNVDSKAEAYGWGGDHLGTAGVKITKSYTEYSIMGFWEVFLKLFTLNSLLKTCVNEIESLRPDQVILVDFGGFNLRIAKKLHNKGFKVCYYIPPKAWAWNESRVNHLKNYCDLVLCILPFEEKFFRDRGVNAWYVGNPSYESLVQFENNPNSDTNHVALFPGSRLQEIRKALPVFVNVVHEFKNLNFQLAAISNIDKSEYSAMQLPNIKLVFDEPYEILKKSNVAVITSGTASLEAAIMGVPHIVVYKTHKLSFHIIKMLIKVKWISLVNLILGKEVVPELIQSKFNAVRISSELTDLLKQDSDHRNDMIHEFGKLREKLKGKKASVEAARLIAEAG